jgi:hypothetical protein
MRLTLGPQLAAKIFQVAAPLASSARLAVTRRRLRRLGHRRTFRSSYSWQVNIPHVTQPASWQPFGHVLWLLRA